VFPECSGMFEKFWSVRECSRCSRCSRCSGRFGNVRMEERGLLLLLEARLGWPLTLSNFLELQLCKYLHLTVLSP